MYVVGEQNKKLSQLHSSKNHNSKYTSMYLELFFSIETILIYYVTSILAKSNKRQLFVRHFLAIRF